MVFINWGIQGGLKIQPSQYWGASYWSLPSENRDRSGCLESIISTQKWRLGHGQTPDRKSYRELWHRFLALSSFLPGKAGVRLLQSNTEKLGVFEVTVDVNVLGTKHIIIIPSSLETQQHSSLYRATHLYSAYWFLLLFSISPDSPAGLPAL